MHSIQIQHLPGMAAYEATQAAMHAFTDNRTADTPDEIWVLQHEPVFTLGQAGKKEHILRQGPIPIVQSDRGGQVTYHGPGQWVFYVLLDLKRRQLGVRQLVTLLEQATIAALAELWQVTAFAKPDAPGVYVVGSQAKIASIGLRVRRGCSFHGLAVNVDMDLSPFSMINPCGYQGLQVTHLKNETQAEVSLEAVKTGLLNQLIQDLEKASCK